MITPKDLSILLMLGDVLLLGILMNTQTFIGEKGRKNELIFLSLMSLLGVFILFPEIIYYEGINGWDTIFWIALGVLLIFCGVFLSRRILAESEDEIVVEHMTSVTVCDTLLFDKRPPSIKGYVDGVYTPIIIMGADRVWLTRIKESGQTEITILRYASSKRVYDIVLPQYHNVKDSFNKEEKEVAK